MPSKSSTNSIQSSERALYSFWCSTEISIRIICISIEQFSFFFLTRNFPFFQKTTFLSTEQYDILEIIGREREKGILQLDIPKKLKVENYQYHIKVLLKFELMYLFIYTKNELFHCWFILFLFSKSIRILCPFTLLLVLQRYFPFLNKVKTLKDTIADKSFCSYFLLTCLFNLIYFILFMTT